MEKALLTAGIEGDVVVATSPKVAGLSMTITGVFGIDGVIVVDDDLPITMTEGAPGVYRAALTIENIGLYFVEFASTVVRGSMIVRVTDGITTADGTAGQEMVIGMVTPISTASVAVTVTDREGGQVGSDTSGDAITWPVSATQVDGHPTCWYIDDVVFDDGGKLHVAMRGDSGPVWNDVITIFEPVQGSAAYFSGWQPTAAYSVADWISVAKIRRQIGWSAGTVSDRAVRDLRRMAVDTFISRTNRWVPRWDGTWYGLRAQGSRLYLPVSPMLAQDGAPTDPVVSVVDRSDQSLVELVPSDLLAWRTRGPHLCQPYVEVRNSAWMEHYDVKVEGSFGLGAVPLRVEQCLLGLIRWHSLGYSVGPDEARDMATLNRIASESSRERNVSYDESAISKTGLTGDPVTDRILAEYTIHPGPWRVRA